MTPDALAKLRLARTSGVGPLTFRRLAERFTSAADALAALPDLARGAGREGLTPAADADIAREVEAMRRLGAHFVFLDDALYPPLLALLADPPPVLAVHGSIDLMSTRAVGIVGARNASANGMRVAEALAADVAARGVTVVSGLARGIDTAAHTGAIGTGFTVACVAGGLDQPYPEENAPLQARIAERGAVVTEAPWGTAPQARHFPRRNRIIAGLSLGLVVVEAALRSGTLITARLAQDADREIFAVPGSPLDPRCLGSNDLIRQGAHLTESAGDVLAHLPDHPSRQGLERLPLFARAVPVAPGPGGMAEPRAGFDAGGADAPRVRAEVAGLLSASPTEIDVVIRRSQFAPAAVMAALSDLELAQRLELLPGGRVALLQGGPGRA